MNNLIKELLNDTSHHIEFNGHLSNHVKHAVVAFNGLGSDDSIIQNYYNNYIIKNSYGYPLEPRRPVLERINDKNFQKYLGSRKNFTAFFDYFLNEIETLGIGDTLIKYNKMVRHGWLVAFTHALIHTGWATYSKNKVMLAEGLAYYAYSYYDLYGGKEFIESNKDDTYLDRFLNLINSRDFIEEVKHEQNLDKNTQNLHQEIKRSGLQYRIASLSNAALPDLINSNLNDEESIDTIKLKIRNIVCALYLARPGSFILVHLITSLFSVESINQYYPDDLKRKYYIDFLNGIKIIIASEGINVPIDKFNRIINTFNIKSFNNLMLDTAKSRCEFEEDEHNAKLVFVATEWFKEDNNLLYQVTATQFTDTPELPDTFQEIEPQKS